MQHPLHERGLKSFGATKSFKGSAEVQNLFAHVLGCAVGWLAGVLAAGLNPFVAGAMQFSEIPEWRELEFSKHMLEVLGFKILPPCPDGEVLAVEMQEGIQCVHHAPEGAAA